MQDTVDQAMVQCLPTLADIIEDARRAVWPPSANPGSRHAAATTPGPAGDGPASRR
jgi:hypothetical protein